MYITTFPTVERRCKQLHAKNYISLPLPSVFLSSLLIKLGISVSSKQFVEWRDRVNGHMQLPVIDVKIGDHEIWPVLSVIQRSLIVCILPLIEQNVTKQDSLLQMSSVSVSFSVLLGILNFLNVNSQEELPVWKPLNYKGKQHIHLKFLEYVRCIQSEHNKSLCHYEVFGQILVQADLEGPLTDVTVSVTTDKSYPLDSIILHPCVHMHGATAATSVTTLLRRLRFSPPPNEFVLLQYCSPALKEPPIQGVFKMLGESSIELLVQLKLSDNMTNTFEYCEVFVVFFNRGPVKSSELNSTYGSPKLSDDKHSLKWNIGTKFPKELEVALTAKLEFAEKPVLPSSDPFCFDKNCYAQINFKQNNSTLSGCNIDPKSVIVSQSNKTKISMEKSTHSTEYRLWNNYGDLPFPVNILNKFDKLFV